MRTWKTRSSSAPRELSELLEQQTATSEVLEVISSSPGELEPVFRKMLENATRVCGANFGTMNLWDGEKFNIVADLQCPTCVRGLRQQIADRSSSGQRLGHCRQDASGRSRS